MKTRQLKWLTLTLIAACTPIKSSSIVTNSIYPEFSAVSDGETISVKAKLYLESPNNGTFIELDEADSLMVQYGEETYDLNQSFGGFGSLSADFSESGQEEIMFVLHKNQAQIDGSMVILPDNFDILGPTESASLGGDDMLDIRWSATEEEDDMHVKIEGMCIKTHEDIISASRGEYPFPVYALQRNVLGEAQDSCNVTITLEQRKVGVLDDSFDDGVIFGAQQRSVTVSITH